MNHPPSRILRDLLTTGSSRLFTLPDEDLDWPLYIGHMPPTDRETDDCAAIYDTAGVKEGRTVDGVEQTLDGFQLRLRSDGYEEGWVKAKAVSDFLATVHNETVTISGDSYEVDSITQPSTPFALGVEEGSTRRQLFTINGLLRLIEGA